MFFDYWLLFIFENYIFLTICSLLNFYYFEWKNYGDAINSFFSVSTGFFVFVFPIFVVIFFSKRNNLDLIQKLDPVFLGRYGSILEGLNFKRRGNGVLLYISLTMFSQLWLAGIVVLNRDHHTFNIFMVNIYALIMMMVTGYAEAMLNRTADDMNQIN